MKNIDDHALVTKGKRTPKIVQPVYITQLKLHLYLKLASIEIRK